MGEFYGNQHTVSPYSEHDHEDIVEAVAELAEELGRPPTTADVNQAEGTPSIATLYRILEDDWASTLREAGVEPTKEQRRSVSTDRREWMLADLRRTNRETEGDTLRLRQYDEHGSFSGSSMKERFGSWSAACEAADLECGTRHGIQCIGPQGNRLDSQHERLVAAFLDDCGVEYEVHPDVADLGFESDFYLPDVDLWVEVDGYVAGGRPNVANMEAKRDYFESNHYDYVVVKDGDELAEVLWERDVLSAQRT
jgi:hypothetical protein